MEWLTENWFWAVIGAAFIVMHLFGHGGHGVMVEVTVKDAAVKQKMRKRGGAE